MRTATPRAAVSLIAPAPTAAVSGARGKSPSGVGRCLPRGGLPNRDETAELAPAARVEAQHPCALDRVVVVRPRPDGDALDEERVRTLVQMRRRAEQAGPRRLRSRTP